MEDQITFTDVEYGNRKRTTKREEFLNKMDDIIPWEAWVDMIRPYYPKGEHGRPARGIETMLYLILKKNFKHNLSLYLIAYGVFRFLIEYVRCDDRGELVGFITPSQFWSVLMVFAGVAILFVMKHILVKAAQNEKIP